MKTLTATYSAWLTPYASTTIAQIESSNAVNVLQLMPPGIDMSTENWVFVGTAQITVEIPDIKEVHHQNVAQLTKMREELIKENTAKVLLVDDVINSLLAIEN